MDIFDSPWLINMLAKSSKTPQGRLLSLFDILDDWLNAPHIQKTSNLNTSTNSLLIDFCTKQAQTIGAENPTMLAEHIVLIARNAAQQFITQQTSGQVSINSLGHAKKAAHALILAQTHKSGVTFNLLQSKPARYSIAASLALLLSTTAIWFSLPTQMHITQPMLAQNNAIITSAYAHEKGLTAQDATKMYAKYDLMRQGTCQFPEALFIPDKHKAIYLENVVGGNLPTTLSDLAVANFYLEQVRCNFTPMLMAASK
jgi:hypothetical protein